MYFCKVVINKKMSIMESLVVYPTTAQQSSLLQSLMEEMKVHFTVKKEKKKDDSLFTKEAYYAMLDERIASAERGNYRTIKGKQELKHFLEQL